MQHSIWNYYGLQKCDGRKLQNYQYKYTELIEDNLELVELGDTVKEHTIVLFISIKTTTILERSVQPHILLEQRFGLLSDTLSEHRIKSFEGVLRTCAVKVHNGQFLLLLKILFDWPSCSFAIIFDDHEFSSLLTKLHCILEDELLTPSVIKKCSNASLNEYVSFLHVIRGNDGYSVNLFSQDSQDKTD